MRARASVCLVALCTAFNGALGEKGEVLCNESARPRQRDGEGNEKAKARPLLLLLLCLLLLCLCVTARKKEAKLKHNTTQDHIVRLPFVRLVSGRAKEGRSGTERGVPSDRDKATNGRQRTREEEEESRGYLVLPPFSPAQTRQTPNRSSHRPGVPRARLRGTKGDKAAQQRNSATRGWKGRASGSSLAFLMSPR